MLVFESSIISFFGILATCITIFFLFRSYQYFFGKKTFSNKIEIFGSILFVIGFGQIPIQILYNAYLVQQAISDGLVHHVQGVVEKFVHTKSFKESFVVNGVKFECIKGGSPVYYDKIIQEGSFIRGNGQKVKIEYIVVDGENKIIKLWIFPSS